jgi:simple sugar transport system ATP-binding protein
VDVASKELLLGELDRMTSESGVSLLLASDELDDLVICDRVIVLVRGEIFTEFTEPPFDREALIAATEGMEAGHE